MRITPQGKPAILLVDPVVGAFQPIPAASFQQRLSAYQIEGGPELVFPRGGTQPLTAPQVVLIDQQTDAAAQAILRTLGAAIIDPSQQPMQVDWDDTQVTPFDGRFYIADLGTPEVSSDFRGRIKLTLQMRPVVAYVAPQGAPLLVMVNGGAPTSVLGGPIIP